MTDRIMLTGVRAAGTHGVLPEEHDTPQMFVVDVTLEVDLAPAGRSDDLADTVSYADVARDVVDIVTGEHVDLIEVLAERIATSALRRPLVDAVEVTVHKPQAPVGVPFGDVAVHVRRLHDRAFVVALGGNQGDVETTLAAAVQAIDETPGTRVDGISSLYDTAPVGGPDQPTFVNAVAIGHTTCPPRAFLRRLHDIEASHGRVREVRWGPRTLDLDLVQVGDPAEGTDVVVDGADLTLPHPRAGQRSFVLVPWAEVDPSAVTRIDGNLTGVAELLDRLPGGGIGPARRWIG